MFQTISAFVAKIIPKSKMDFPLAPIGGNTSCDGKRE